MKTPHFIQLHFEDQALIRAELLAGLQAANAYTSPKYRYDQLGSKLFEVITEVPEYYPTRTETSFFAQHGNAMASHVPRGAQLIDFGVGMGFSESLALPPAALDPTLPRELFYLGSSIGNFTQSQALAFLVQAHAAFRAS